VVGKSNIPASHEPPLILGGFSFFGSFLMPGENGQCTEIN
jgi:hypothetical protein